jgi:tetratricopeptide (TPR) repeat protein
MHKLVKFIWSVKVDLLKLSEKSLYFDEPLSVQAEELIVKASEGYGDSNVEPFLLEAYDIAPDHLTVLVALYRYYYYQHRLEDALVIAYKALDLTGKRLSFPNEWNQLTNAHLGAGALISMGMVRFYLLSLKAAGYLNLRLQKWQAANDMLLKVTELDEADQLGAAALLGIANSVQQNQNPKSVAV